MAINTIFIVYTSCNHPTYATIPECFPWPFTFELTTHSWPSQPPVWPVVFCRPGLPLRPWWPGDGTAELRGWGETPTQASTAGHKSAPSTIHSEHRKKNFKNQMYTHIIEIQAFKQILLTRTLSCCATHLFNFIFCIWVGFFY